jgi:hypothetical protein
MTKRMQKQSLLMIELNSRAHQRARPTQKSAPRTARDEAQVIELRGLRKQDRELAMHSMVTEESDDDDSKCGEGRADTPVRAG